MLRMNLFMKQIMIVPFVYQNHLVGENVSINVDYTRLVDDDYFVNTMRSQTYWSFGGNIFEGPSNRGAFDPRMQYPEDGFEYDSEPIIGTNRYRQMLVAFNSLKDFVRKAPKMSEINRYAIGTVTNFMLEMALSSGQMVPMDRDQWEERAPTEAELQVFDNAARRRLRKKTFWAIKKTNETLRRARRSTEKVCEKLNVAVRQRWTEFVLDSLTDQIEASARNRSLEWSCDLDRLYEEYRFSNWTNVVCYNSNRGFDHFLYSKLFRQPRWRECIEHNRQSSTDGGNHEWCLTWRRLLLNTDFERIDGQSLTASFRYIKTSEIL